MTDGFCDDPNNTPECEYDGGDCCGADVSLDFCTQCECLDPNVQQESTTTYQSTILTSLFPDTTPFSSDGEK